MLEVLVEDWVRGHLAALVVGTKYHGHHWRVFDVRSALIAQHQEAAYLFSIWFTSDVAQVTTISTTLLYINTFQFEIKPLSLPATPMAEVIENAAKGKDVMTAVKEKIEEFINGRSNDNKNELPQDYLLSTTDSIAALLVEMKSGESPRDIDSDATVVTANKTPNHWVSPNKSEEEDDEVPSSGVPSSMDVSPSTDDLQFELSSVSDTIKRLIDVFAARKEDAENNSDSDFDYEYETGFTKVESNDVENVDLTVIGKRIEMVGTPTALANAANEALPEALLYASSKSFVNIIHGEKEIMLIIPSVVSF